MEYLLKASAVIAIFFVCYKICLQRDTFFEQNRWFLLAGLVVAAFLPFIVIPIYIEAQPTNFDYLVFVEDNIATAPTSNSFDILSLLNFIYVLGVIVFSLRFIFQITSLLPLIINSEKQRIDGYNFVKTHQNISPFSFFNYIVYNPKPFNESELEQIVTHEKVHVNQHHSIDILLSQISCIIFWFNPLVWFYNKDLKQNLEFIADKEAIHYTNCKKSYQYTLLKTSMPNQSLALTNNFYNSLIKKRIVMLHKSKSKKINLIKFTLIIPALALFLMSFNSKTVIIEKKPTKETIDKTSNNLLQEPYKVIITKDASKENLDQIIEEAKTKGVTLKFKGIKRNSNNEIIAISASFKNENGSGNYHLKGDKPITSFAYYQKKDSFGFASVSNELKKNNLCF
ncbi:MAG: hypothetical protein COZ17_08100 [Flavobacteriaceae bacterium CG_4_10_14_3_um_filter_33_47]|nr:M56 family metallopeptidase [Flavobacteriales bacterium]PIV93177.1 MAG: hypothetical protein COW44_11010 [Flavobacteriaceae bacterium CG17_big_fil_post_rev_8_21_14_2_50_33_15]PIY11020.1 MAG: hypothetical protein COZ17_08100 [Flavobacteriaceae bacterium CG_4_10_14_3_um_filter_33_47]PJB17917.1 MAG: hypothetical protein CO117_09880 [Flavobacteriaceae bacterium CG_4_9_14_3_um_filter_33_16]